MVLDLLRQEKVLLVHGKGFNWHSPDHFRVVTLPYVNQLEEAITKLARFCRITVNNECFDNITKGTKCPLLSI